MSFSCPLCHQPLLREKNSYICPQRHQFDMAKEGYVNLLPVQHKRSRDPGDSAEMMQARRAFLDAGHYQPLRDAIVAQLREWLDEKATAVLDIGCGEGYYTHAFADAVFELSDDGLASVKIPNGELTNADDEDVAEQAKDACPSGAIEIEEK